MAGHGAVALQVGSVGTADGPPAWRAIFDAIQTFFGIGNADGGTIDQRARNGFTFLKLKAHVDEGVRTPKAVVGLNVRRVATAIGVLRDIGPDGSTFVVILEDDVDYPRQCVGSVERGGTIREHF